MKKRFDEKKRLFYSRMMRISWTDHVNNDEVFRKKWKQKRYLYIPSERQLKFLEYIMKKVGLEKLILLGQIKGRRGKQRITNLANLFKGMANKVE